MSLVETDSAVDECCHLQFHSERRVLVLPAHWSVEVVNPFSGGFQDKNDVEAIIDHLNPIADDGNPQCADTDKASRRMIGLNINVINPIAPGFQSIVDLGGSRYLVPQILIWRASREEEAADGSNGSGFQYRSHERFIGRFALS